MTSSTQSQMILGIQQYAGSFSALFHSIDLHLATIFCPVPPTTSSVMYTFYYYSPSYNTVAKYMIPSSA
jgi:hypothetical protein